MDEKKRIDALEAAITNEMRERKFYLKHAERTHNPLGRAMFQQIADDELEHYRRLKDLDATWKDEFPRSVPSRIHGSDLEQTLKQVLSEMDTLPEADRNELEAIQTAIDFEAKGAARYLRLRDLVTDPREKAFFDLLAAMEQEHLRVLKETAGYLTDPGRWAEKDL